MAEGESDSWWSSWVTVAREKSISVLNATRKDLTEFVTTIGRDTSTAVNEVAGSVRSYMAAENDQSMTENEQVDADTKTNVSSTTKDTSCTYDRIQTTLEAIRNDPSTYCSIPEAEREHFAEWSNEFVLSSVQEEISKLLVASDSIRRHHSELVPSQVSYESFWCHYFYRIHLLDAVDEKRAKLVARAQSQGKLIRWDEEDDEETAAAAAVAIEKTDGAMTDSSESFVCISEGTDDIKDPITNESPPPLTLDIKGDDSDWEKWDD